MATRTAPALTEDPNFSLIHSRWVDASGDIRSISLQIDPTATDTQIDALLDNTQTASNASLFHVEVGRVWSSNPSKASATAGVYPSVYDNVVILMKTPTNFSRNWFVPAPDATIMPSDSDLPIIIASSTLALSVSAVLEGTSTADWDAVSARFTERREKNQRVLI